MNEMRAAPVCVIIGVGPGNGAAIARRFASDGYAVVLVARSAGLITTLARELPDARALVADAGDPEALASAMAAVEQDLGRIDVIVYNAGPGVWGTLDQVSVADVEQAFRVNVVGAFAAVRAALPTMRARGSGSVVFIGATASRRGNVKTAAFAPAKAAQRSLAESMARYLWPQGIHVSLVVIDGIVDLPHLRAQLPDKPDDFFVEPDDVAETVHHLTTQRRSAWSFEVEARPFREPW